MTGVYPAMDRDSTPWWSALARHELMFQRCGECATWRWPARAMCNVCGSFGWGWFRSSGRGEVVSWIVNHHAFLPGFDAPYAVVSVRMDEQPDLVLLGAYAGPPDDPALAIGARVVAAYDEVPGDPPAGLLRWLPEPLPDGKIQSDD